MSGHHWCQPSAKPSHPQFSASKQFNGLYSPFSKETAVSTLFPKKTSIFGSNTPKNAKDTCTATKRNGVKCKHPASRGVFCGYHEVTLNGQPDTKKPKPNIGVPNTSNQDVPTTSNQDVRNTSNQDVASTSNQDVPITSNQDVPITSNQDISKESNQYIIIAHLKQYLRNMILKENIHGNTTVELHFNSTVARQFFEYIKGLTMQN
jgi:hypothetical protein